MKVIDLLNKIANGEEVPKKIKYNGIEMYFCKPCKIYEVYSDNELCGKDLYNILDNLNNKVEILEEEKKIPKKLYKYMEKEEEGCFENILKVYDGGEYEINEDMSFVIDKINEIIDYLKSKG